MPSKPHPFYILLCLLQLCIGSALGPDFSQFIHAIIHFTTSYSYMFELDTCTYASLYLTYRPLTSR